MNIKDLLGIPDEPTKNKDTARDLLSSMPEPGTEHQRVTAKLRPDPLSLEFTVETEQTTEQQHHLAGVAEAVREIQAERPTLGRSTDPGRAPTSQPGRSLRQGRGWWDMRF